MKKGSRPELSPTWWQNNRPDSLKALYLKTALSKYVRANAALDRRESSLNYAKCFRALKDVQASVTKTIKACGKKKEYQDTIQVLKKYDAVIQGAENDFKEDETAFLEEQEEDVDKIFKGDELIKLIRKAKKKPLPFAFGLGKSPEEHCLILHRRRAGKKLWLKVKKQLRCTRGTWGIAEVRGREIQLRCEKNLSGAKRHVKALIKANKSLLLTRVRIFGPDGNENDDEGDWSSIY